MVQYYSERMVCYFNPRSPHGERPPAKFPASTCTEDFNPRSPHGERPVAVWTIEPQDEHFNPRSPHGERPRCLLHGHRARAISIHAPRTGSDAGTAKCRTARPLFQSTLPARGATPAMLSARPRAAFQSTLPARGATIQLFAELPNPFQFQSTLPARGATTGADGILKSVEISIHAPRTGSDART